ncbi:MAG TPA: pyrroloquinoline-quinone synthase PqqC [Myxococcota bacterium]|nr:pyrroloquinoline-quinone synthase PqqC [Myxococcota bacterium]
MTPEALEARLRDVLARRYHDLHPFNQRMHAGTLTPDEIRTWVRNRYYYQTRIPIKDGIILAKSEDPGFRRNWIRRIRDHDGDAAHEGGLELWLRLAEAVGLDPADVASLRDVLPGVRRACDEYVRFVTTRDLLESVASSLTELAAGGLMAQRIACFEEHYPWVKTEGLRYFESRTELAPRDAAEGLGYVLNHARSEEDQERCVAALERKCEILWALLDGVEWGSRRFRLARGVKLHEEPEGPVVVLAERAVRTNETGREILELCDGSRTAGEVAAAMRASHREPPEVEREAYAFLEEMEKLGVLESAA